MKEEQYFINKGNNCSPKIPSRFTNYLDKNNFLSEFQSEESKQNVKDNLGITSDLTAIKNLIDRKVIESGNIVWDLVPTESNTENVLSSDSLYKEFLKYVTEEQLDQILQEFFSTLNSRIGEEQNSRETEDSNLSNRIDSLQGLYNSLKETLYQQIISSIIENYEKRIKTIETKVESFLKSSTSGTSFTDSFGEDTYIGISQQTLTDEWNNVYHLLEEALGRTLLGFTWNVTPTYIYGEWPTTIHITAIPTNNENQFEYIKLSVNEEIIDEVFEKTNTYSFDIDLQESVNIRMDAKVLGKSYYRTTNVSHYDSFWLGGGSNYSDIMIEVNNINFSKGTRLAKDVTVTDGQHIIIVMGDSWVPAFIRADMNGAEIKFDEADVTIDGKNYKVLTSKSVFEAGTYNIDING